MKIDIFFLKYMDIIFTMMSGLLFIAFSFLATHLNSKFFIFFISSFANIFCYSAILNDQYNFSYTVLLNIIFMLVIIFYYILIDLKEDSLPTEFIRRTTIRYIIIITCFLTSFISIISIANFFMKNKEILYLNKQSAIVFNNREKLKTENNEITIEKKMVIDKNEKVVNMVHEKNFKNTKINTFKYFNVSIFIYVIFLSINYFIHKKT